jgi:hypothetical protein
MWDRARQRPSLSARAGEVYWDRTHPNPLVVNWITVELAITNSSPTPGSVSLVRLEVEGFSPYYQAEIKLMRNGAFEPPVPTEWTSRIPQERWFQAPSTIGAWASLNGLVGFRTIRSKEAKPLTSDDLVAVESRLVVVTAGSGDLIVPLRRYPQGESVTPP